jgi:DNA-binding transcriptional LysR family regulator
MTVMTQAETEPALPPASGAAPQGVELRHLRYFVAVADAGTFTHAAERVCIAQPTLSQQIRRLEEIIGTPLLQRGREGVRLTQAGAVLLEDARAVLSLLDHSLGRTRQAAGLDRPRLRFVIPADLPESLAAETASRLRSVADAVEVDITWMETELDADFSPIRQRRVDAGLGWMNPASDFLPDPLDVMQMGEFEPDAWVPSTHPAALRAVIGLDELVSTNVIHGPRRGSAETYDRWLDVLRTQDRRFDFTDPPFRQSFAVTLAFAASASAPTAVLTGPRHRIGTRPVSAGPDHPTGAGTSGMVPVRIAQHQLTATAGLVWHGDLPRQLQQILFDTADAISL